MYNTVLNGEKPVYVIYMVNFYNSRYDVQLDGEKCCE